MVGIAVGVWGDTGEIAYITPYGYHRIPNMNQIKPYEMRARARANSFT
jgi:hypothetical protein